MNTYVVNRMPEGFGQCPLEGEFAPNALPAPWSLLNEARLDAYPWDQNGYRPACGARLGWNAGGLHLLMYANEKTVRATVTAFGGRVCEDSCMEFFCAPNPLECGQYFNCECTSYPAMLIGVGTDRYDRAELARPPRGLAPQASAHKGGWWAVSYTLPAAYLYDTFGCELRAGTEMRGNFYICGDSTQYPHFGMWQGFDPAAVPKPDFHQPSMFGRLVLGA